MTLAMVASSEEVRLTTIQGGRCMRKRLADLGLNLGLTVRVVQRDRHGPLIGIEGSRLVLDEANKSITHLRQVYGDDVDTVIADRRYGWINGLVKESVQRIAASRRTLSDKIVTNRVLGIPIFLALMWVVFKVTTDVAGPYLDWVDGVVGRTAC